MENKLKAAWNEYRILEKQQKWEDAIKQLDSIKEANKGDSATVSKSLWEKGEIYKERLKKYDEAIKVYQELGQPPRSLWQIQECHHRKGDLKSAVAVLNEIEAAFPDDAPEAAWRRAEYYDWGKQQELCVKEARGILKKYPKSPASSRAHQLLEKYGIDTGGAVAD